MIDHHTPRGIGFDCLTLKSFRSNRWFWKTVHESIIQKRSTVLKAYNSYYRSVEELCL